ncbi:hypothetical protein G210_5634 [Candida maltosa Xu316]|uniref:Uncharacterized protein n=1 Tax=Candida maltosa (strain Xu316) TaxID=1245528 RepID=M3HQ14_CANMX|nr:hypothetical protein G210_5634 [Candida maltosa Xu316]
MSQQLLHQDSSQLSIINSELSLLNFFEKKGKFIMGYDDTQYILAWDDEINSFSFHSPSIKSTLLANAATVFSNYLRTKHSTDPSSLIRSNELFAAGMKYFQKSIYLQYELVEQINKSDHPNVLQVRELLASCLVQFGYFMINNHKMLPLLSLNRNQVDLISLMQSHRNLRIKYFTYVTDVVSGQKILPYFTIIPPASPEFEKFCPLTRTLSYDLIEIQDMSEDEKEIMQNVINYFEASLLQAQKVNFACPVLANILFYSDEFRNSLYMANEFALRLLFVYASLCALTGIPLNRLDSIYGDYITWYKERVVQKYGSFVYSVDRELHSLVMNTSFVLSPSTIHDFDPTVECIKYEQ